MEIKTAELTGIALDWALAKTKVSNWAEIVQDKKVELIDGKVCVTAFGGVREFVDHTNPATCLGLIEEHVISIDKNMPVGAGVGGWRVFPKKGVSSNGSTVAEAVARCVVAMQLGDEVEVPDELCEVQS